MMDRQDLVDEIRSYLHDADHWRLLLAHIQEPDPHNAHLHSYVYTSIHPGSLEAIMHRFFAGRGWPITRRINWIRPRPGLMSLHSIEPEGKVHFDLQWIYEESAGLRPADGVEANSNLILWNRPYVDEFYRSFPFREVGTREEAACREFFASAHWKDGLEIAARPDVPHMQAR